MQVLTLYPWIDVRLFLESRRLLEIERVETDMEHACRTYHEDHGERLPTHSHS